MKSVVFSRDQRTNTNDATTTNLETLRNWLRKLKQLLLKTVDLLNHVCFLETKANPTTAETLVIYEESIE